MSNVSHADDSNEISITTCQKSNKKCAKMTRMPPPRANLIHTQAFCKKLSWNNVTPEGHKVCVIEYMLS